MPKSETNTGCSLVIDLSKEETAVFFQFFVIRCGMRFCLVVPILLKKAMIWASSNTQNRGAETGFEWNPGESEWEIITFNTLSFNTSTKPWMWCRWVWGKGDTGRNATWACPKCLSYRDHYKYPDFWESNKQSQSIVDLSGLPYDSALFGLVSYNCPLDFPNGAASVGCRYKFLNEPIMMETWRDRMLQVYNFMILKLISFHLLLKQQGMLQVKVAVKINHRRCISR